MSEDTKKSLYILTKAGGWADDDIEEEQESEEVKPKTTAWSTIAKPEVVPIGTDFELEVKKEEKEPEPRKETRSDHPFSREGRGRGDYRRGGPRQYRGFGDSSQNGQNKRWGRSSTTTSEGRKPLNLEPRSSAPRSSTQPKERESPFGGAKPITPKYDDDVEPSTPKKEENVKKVEQQPKESPFGDARPNTPKYDDEDSRGKPSTTSSYAPPKGRRQQTGSDRPFGKTSKPQGELGKRTDSKQRKQGRRENGSAFFSNKGKGTFQKKGEKGGSEWTESRTTTRQSNYNTTKKQEEKKDQNTVNTFALLSEEYSE